MDSFCRDRPPQPGVETEGESEQPERPGKGDLYSRGPLPIQLRRLRTETKADAPVYVDSHTPASEQAGSPGKSPRALAMG